MSTAIEPLHLNGSHGEGGGALLRTALVMSSLTGRPVTVGHVRGALRSPGLNAEDLTILDLLASAVDADVLGDVGDSEAGFRPRRPPRAVRQTFDSRSYSPSGPGACPVVAQAALPVLARGGAVSRIELHGATHGANTLGFDAFAQTSLAAMEAQGLVAEGVLRKAAFLPNGHGCLLLEVEPSVPLPVEWKARGKLLACGGSVAVAGYSKELAERAVDRVHALFGESGLRPEVTLTRFDSDAPEIQVTCWARFETGAGAGSSTGRGKAKVEQAAEAAFRDFHQWYATEATVDMFLADQMLVPACLAEGRTVYTTPRVTRRLMTMAWVVRQFLPIQVTVHGTEGEPGRVVVER